MKKGEKYVCRECGLEVACTSACGCCATPIVCCDKPMQKKVETKKTSKKTAKKKKPKRK